MVDVEIFSQIMLSVFGSILLIALIILVIRLIIIANKVDKMIDEVNTKVANQLLSI